MNDQEILSILEPKEKIIWNDRVSRKVLLFNLVFSLAIIIIISLLFFFQSTINYTSNNIPKSVTGSSVGFIFLIFCSFSTILNFFINYVKKYVITNKRVLIKSGIIGTDFSSIYFTQIRNSSVVVNLVDKIFGVGTINIDTGKISTTTSGNGNTAQSVTRTAYDKLLHIEKPYDVYKYFQTALSDREEGLHSGRADRESMAATDNK